MTSDNLQATTEENERLDHLFSPDYKHQEEEKLQAMLTQHTVADPGVPPPTEPTPSIEQEEESANSSPPTETLHINFDSLRGPVGVAKKEEEQPTLAPIIIHKPSILKVVLLQTTTHSPTHSHSHKTMSLISLSGVILCNKEGVWQLMDGHNYHNDVPEESKTESYTLEGGVRVIYDHTHSRWHVLPPIAPPPLSPASSITDSLTSNRYTCTYTYTYTYMHVYMP